jgi:hypothetical protein
MATAVQYVDYTQAGQGNGQGVGQPGLEVCLSGPAIAWAAEAKVNPSCWAVLRDGQLLLGNQGGLKTLRTDLPLSASSFAMNGMPLGMVGNTACLLDDNGNLTLGDVTADPDHAPTQVPPVNAQGAQCILDGPVIYMTGPQGIQCIKARSSEKVFSLRPWPKGALPEAVNPSAAAAVAAPPAAWDSYAPGPAVPSYGTAPAAYAGPAYPVYTPSSYGGPGYATPAQPDPSWRQSPALGHAEGGVLYTVSLPGRVVALGDKEATKQVPPAGRD